MVLNLYTLASQIVIAILTGIGIVWAINASLGRELRADLQALTRQMAQLGERMARIHERLGRVHERLAQCAGTRTSSPASSDVR